MERKFIRLVNVEHKLGIVWFQVRNSRRIRPFRHKDIVLESSGNPAWNNYWRTLFLQGNVKDLDNIVVTVSVSVFEEIKEAVKAFNNKYGKIKENKL